MGRLPRRGAARSTGAVPADWPARRSTSSVSTWTPERRVGDLSIELQQEVEIARAVSASPRVLILDEATSSLSESATERLLERLQQLREQGVAILFISHRLRELYGCAQRATVLRDGRLIGTVVAAGVPRARPRADDGRPRDQRPLQQALDRAGRVRAHGDGTSDRGRRADRDRPLRPSAARSSASPGSSARARPSSGSPSPVRSGRDGRGTRQRRPLRLRSPRRAIAAGVGFVPEDRKRSAIFPTQSGDAEPLGRLGRASSRAPACQRARRAPGWRPRRSSVSPSGRRSIDTPITAAVGREPAEADRRPRVHARRRRRRPGRADARASTSARRARSTDSSRTRPRPGPVSC